MRPEAFPRLRAPMCRDGMEPLLVAEGALKPSTLDAFLGKAGYEGIHPELQSKHLHH